MSARLFDLRGCCIPTGQRDYRCPAWTILSLRKTLLAVTVQQQSKPQKRMAFSNPKKHLRCWPKECGQGGWFRLIAHHCPVAVSLAHILSIYALASHTEMVFVSPHSTNTLMSSLHRLTLQDLHFLVSKSQLPTFCSYYHVSPLCYPIISSFFQKTPPSRRNH